MFKLDLEKAGEPEIKLQTSVGSLKKQESSRKSSTYAWLTMPKPFCGSQQTGKFWKRWEYQTTWPAFWEICMQVKKQQYVNCELSDVQAGFRKWRRTRDQISNICWIIEKAREFQKDIYLCVIDYAKGFGCVGHNKLWKILQAMGN